MAMTASALGHVTRKLGPIFDETFPLIAMSTQDGPHLLADLLRTGDRQIRSRLYSQRNLWIARQAVMDGDKQLAVDLIDQTIYRLGESETEQQEQGWLCDRLIEWMGRVADHWRRVNGRLESFCAALKGGEGT